MAVFIECSICGKKIKSVEPNKIRELTGREICTECEEKLKEKLKDVERVTQDALNKIDVLYKKVKSQMSKLDSIYNGFREQVTDQRRRAVAEITTKMDEVISG